LAALGAGKRPAVRVTVGPHTYRTTVAPMGRRYFVPLSADNREAAGVSAGQRVDVDIELDTAAREFVLPDDFDAGLKSDEPRANVLRGALVHASQRVGALDGRGQKAGNAVRAPGKNAGGAQGGAVYALSRPPGASDKTP
jgi:hypothetical protein